MSGTTFEKYGGFSAISKIVMTFYERVLDNDDVGPHFDDIDMPRLIDHQTKFISALMGEPAAMSDDRLKAVHSQIDISNEDFDTVLDLLKAALRDHQVADGDISAVTRAFNEKRSFIVRAQQ